MCPASLPPPHSGRYCGGDVQDAELVCDKNGKGQKCPGMKRCDVIMGCSDLPQADSQAHVLRLPRWPRPHTWPTVTRPHPPALHRHQGCGVPWINTAQCLPNTQVSLGSCCAVQGKSPVPAEPQHSLGALWTWRGAQAAHQAPGQGWHPLHRGCKGKVTHWALGRQRQKYKPVHSEGKERTLPACVHCVYLEGEKNPKTTTNYKQLILQTTSALVK